MFILVLGALIAGGASLLGGALSGIFGGSQARKERRARRQQADYAYRKDIETFNRQNAYNRPQAQMERLKAAGLNPNLVYGQGAVANNAGQIPKYSAPDQQYYKPQIDLGGASNEFFRTQIMETQNENIKQNILLNKQRQINEAAKTLGIFSDSQRKRIASMLASNTMQYQQDAARLTVDKTKAQIQGIDENTKLIKLKQEFQNIKNKIEKQGTVGSQGALIRNAMYIAKELGIPAKTAMKELKRQFQSLPGRIWNDIQPFIPKWAR